MKKRNKFNLSHYRNYTADMGELVPILCKEVEPGDSWQHSTSMLVRLAPLLAPVMHPCHIVVHHWFVPSRLVWDDWEDFITGGRDGLQAPEYPTITVNTGTGWAVGSLADYLGLPTGIDDITVSALPFRAYSLIYNECYRDNNLITPLTVDTTSGVDTTTNQTLQNVAWQKDYFTSARPWEQLGTEVTIPLVGEAPVIDDGSGQIILKPSTGADFADGGMTFQTATVLRLTVDNNAGATPGAPVTVDDPSGLVADLSGADAATVNEVRFAMAWQRVLENMGRYGARYTEMLRRWGVRSSDARLQRPEYLGGGQQTIQFSEVLQTAQTATSGTTTGVGPGDLFGHGIGALRSNRYTKFFEEHGFVISLAFVRPITVYQNGIPRMWNRRTREEFWMPELQHIGQQTIPYKEIRANHATPDAAFGYQDRFDDKRRAESSVAGLFRSGQYYDHFTLARNFSSDPALNGTFVTCSPTKDIFAVPSQDGLLVMASHSIRARSLLAKVGTSFIR